MKKIFTKKWFKISFTIFLTIVIMYTMIYIDVILRARESYLTGEKYWDWQHHPGKKEFALNQELQKELQILDKKLKKGKIKNDQYEIEVERAKFEFQRQMEESSIKYAYVWYQTAVELFSPPESKWVKLSKQKMPLAKEEWKKELKSKGIKFEDYMLE